ncbi:MAG TPA: AAA family ATPase [Candidatus Paceibacterota bacterium]|nr:AAA family ATPase [Candidatus Paceibacterota bacterium]
MIIEFCGLPATGKTTVAGVLVKKKGFHKIKIESRREWLFYNLIFLLKHPIKFFGGLFMIVKFSEGGRDFYLKFMNCFIIHNAKYQKAQRFRLGIIDQGYFQNILSVFNKPIDQKNLASYLKNFLYPDLLVVFDLSSTERQARLIKRGQSVRFGFDLKQVEKWQKASEVNYQLFKKMLPELGLPFCLLEASLAIDVLADKIEQCLKNPK